MKKFYTAGELAKLTGVSYKTIRYYTDRKIISPEIMLLKLYFITESAGAFWTFNN